MRGRIVGMWEAGKTPRQISQLIGCSDWTARRWITMSDEVLNKYSIIYSVVNVSRSAVDILHIY